MNAAQLDLLTATAANTAPGQLDVDEVLALAASEPVHPARAKREHKAPERGRLVRVPGSGLGVCVFYKERHEAGGRTAWYVIDAHNRQYHAFNPDRVRVSRPKKGSPE